MRCAECKGRLLCGRSRCPLVEKFRFLRGLKIEREIEDPTPPSLFVGRIGYPSVYAGPLIAINVDPVYADSPWMWKSIEEAIKLRVSLLRASKRVRIDAVREPDRFVSNIQELAAAYKPLDVEAEIIKVSRKTEFDDVMQPMGYSAVVEKIRLTENPKIPGRVEKVCNDELKASEALLDLHTHGFSTYYLQKIFSAGMLGLPENRRLVPTRWSITAVHSILGEELKKSIAEYPTLSDHLVFSYEHFGNHFEVILSPGNYFFHLVEMWRRKSFWSPKEDWFGADSEDITPKREYSPLGGGYYAARLPVLEYLKKIRKQASAIVLREIKPSYYAPLGVWVVEEGVRRALRSKPIRCASFTEAFRIAASRIEIPVERWKGYVYRQKPLSAFFDV